MKFQVGQKVVMTRQHGRAIETEITKVGRKYVYAGGRVFLATTGAAADGYGVRLLTPEQYAEDQKRDRLRNDLDRAGIRFNDYHGSTFTTPQLERLLLVATGG